MNTIRPNSTNLQGVCVYAVDDDQDLIELYTTFLEGEGYMVRAFNDRAAALASLKEEAIKPQLLVTDYFGRSMSVETFMRCCFVAHPNFRVLMASGFHQTESRSCQVKPDRFIQKPFTPEEFLCEVRAALAGEVVPSDDD